MKPRSTLGMCLALMGSALIASGQSEQGPPVIDIKGIREVIFENWIAADGVFRMKWPCLKVTLTSSADIKGDDVLTRAYFFDKDQKVLSEFKKMPNANREDGSYGLPPLIKARQKIDVFVPIETKSKEGRWRDVVLVFGHPESWRWKLIPVVRYSGGRNSPLRKRSGSSPSRSEMRTRSAPSQTCHRVHLDPPNR